MHSPSAKHNKFCLVGIKLKFVCRKILFEVIQAVFSLSSASVALIFLCVYSFRVLRRFQHCTGHITMGSWKGRGNQYIQFVRVLYCKLLTNGKQLPAFPLEAMPGIEPWPQRWKVRVLPLCHRGPYSCVSDEYMTACNQHKSRNLCQDDLNNFAECGSM